MKVLHAAETIKGGVATVMRLLCIGMTTPDSGVTIRCLVPDSQANELARVSPEVIATFPAARRGLRTSMAFLFRFLAEVRDSKPNVVHLHSSFAGAIGRL
ncbi:MAG: hypothetical protein QM650_06555, partial [Microlunatus sp.]